MDNGASIVSKKVFLKNVSGSLHYLKSDHFITDSDDDYT